MRELFLRRGLWRFTSEYESLVVSESKWFSQMKDVARKSHLQKVFSQVPVDTYKSSQSSLASSLQPQLSVSVEECGIKGLAEATLQSMWAKAEALVKSSGEIIKVPWSDDDKERLVKSSSSSQPHLVTRDSKNNKLYRCDSQCPMFKGFCICSHVLATAQVNGELKSYLDNIKVCKPNLAAIADHGMPSGTGCKGGVAKRKRSRKVTPVVTRSIRPCLEMDPAVPSVSSLMQSEAISSPTSVVSCTPNLEGASISSQAQVVLGANVINYAAPISLPPATTSALAANVMNYAGPVATASASYHGNLKKPFVLKFKTNQIKICQSCRKNFDGTNDTLGLVVARAERRLISNMTTGVQFLGKESNSHYHLHKSCLTAADATFNCSEIVIPDLVRTNLTAYQKIYFFFFFQEATVHTK